MASLKLVLTDAGGDDLNDNIVVDLFSQQTSRQYQKVAFIQRELVISGIEVAGAPLYRVMITPANHRIMQFFVMLSDARVAKIQAPVPIDPTKVRTISGPGYQRLPPKAAGMLTTAEIPRFSDGTGGFLQGTALYDELDKYPLLKACLLNIVAKSAATKLQDQQTCLDHYLGLLRLEQDRIFLRTTAALVEETAHSNAFHSVNPALHDPIPGYQIVSSFKTFDRYGNLQLTFQRRGDTGDDYAADIDIDDAQGIEHIFQVVHNAAVGPTHPYNIHDILLQQTPSVDPGYEFVFAAAAAG
jgi:hypothetical protein